MADLLTKAEVENDSFKNPNSTINEADNESLSTDTKVDKNTKSTDFDDFATSVFEKISKPKFAGNFESKDKLWEKYEGAYTESHGENAEEVFDQAYKASARFHNDLAMQELEDTQLAQIIDDAEWIMPFGDDVQRVDPSMSTTTMLETNSGRLQMLDWWTGATKSTREASVESKSYINGDGIKVDIDHLNDLSDLLDTKDSTGKEIIGFQYDNTSEFNRGDATLRAIYYGDHATGELASVWDLKDSWLSNNGLTSNIAKTTVGSVMNFTMDVLDTAFTLAGAASGALDAESDFYKNAMKGSLRLNQLKMGKSDYDTSKMFTTNNMLDMAINTGLQLLLAGGTAKAANSLSKMIVVGSKKAAVKAGKMTAAKATNEIAKSAAKGYGRKAGLYVLGGMASKDAYHEAIKVGFNEKEAAAIYFASYAAMFQANKLSNFTDDAFSMIGSKRFGNSVAKGVLANIPAEDVAKGVGSKGLLRIASTIGKGTAKQVEKLYSKPGLVGAAFSEAMEEEVELVAQEVVNHLANMYSAIGYKDKLKKPKFKSVMDEGYWEEKGWEALLSGIGGAMGGIMAHGARGLRRKNTTGQNISDDQWPVQGNEADALKRLAFERARGTQKGNVASDKFIETLQKERDNGRFGRNDYSTVWDSEENRYKRMAELSTEEASTKSSQADILYNSIIAQFDHYTALYGAYTGTFEDVVNKHPEIAGVYGEEALFNEVGSLLKTKQDILSNSNAINAPGIDVKLNSILSREDSILDTTIKNAEAEIERLKLSREKESIEAEEDNDTREKKAELLKEGQDEEIKKQEDKLKQSIDETTDKLLLDEITDLAGALNVSGSEMSELLETQRRLNDIEQGKFVERGIINTLTSSNHFRKTIGDGASKKYKQYGNIVENLMNSDLSLKERINARKADGLRFTKDFDDKIKGIPSDLEGLATFFDNSELPFLTIEQKQKLIAKIASSVKSVEEVKLEKFKEHTDLISAISYKLIGDTFEVAVQEGDTAVDLADKVSIGKNRILETIFDEYLDEDLQDVPEFKRRAAAKILHSSMALNEIVKSKKVEEMSRVTYDLEEVDFFILDEDGWEISVNDTLENIKYGGAMGVLDLETAIDKVEIDKDIEESERLIAKVNKAENPLELKEFEGEYFNKNFSIDKNGFTTIDQGLDEALEAIDQVSPRDEEGKIISFTDSEGVNDVKEKIAIRRSQIQLIQRAFKIIGDVRGYNNEKFVDGFDKTANNNTFFSSYVKEMIGDPLRYFELTRKKQEGTITDEESAEFVRMFDIIGTPDSTKKSAFDEILQGLDELDSKADELLDLASKSAESLKQNYYVSTIKYLDELFDSARSALDLDRFEGDKKAEELYNVILGANANTNISASEEGSIEALKSITVIKNALYELGNIVLPSGKLGRNAVGYSEKYDLALNSLYYDPSKFIGNLKDVLEMVGAGKTPAEMKLPTVDQLIVAEQLVVNSVTDLNKFIKSRSYTPIEKLNLNVTTMVGLQGTGKTEIVAGLSTAMIQKDLASKYGDRVTDHKALMCGNTVKQCVKLHEAAKRNGVHIGSVDGNNSMSQFDIYKLLTEKKDIESEEDHLKKVKSKLDGIDIIIYDEASYIEFLEKLPESSADFSDVGTLNTILYQLSNINNLRGKSEPKINLILMGDETQGGFMEGMKSPRNTEADFKITGKGTKGSIGSGRLPRTKQLTRTFRFEVPSLKKDIDAFRDTIKVTGTASFEGGRISTQTVNRELESSWNVISNDANGKLGGMKFNPNWDSLCNDEVTIENIRKQLEADKDFDVIIITNGGTDSIPENSKLRDLVNEFEGSKRIEVASFFNAQGSEAAYSLVNVPNNMLVTTDSQGLPDSGEVNIVSMAMGRAKYFTQLAVTGNAIDLSSSNEVEVTKQSEPEVSIFRESWYKVLNEGLFSSELEVRDIEHVEETTEDESIIKPETDEETVVDLNDPNVSTPVEQDIIEQERNSELGISDGKQETLDAKKQELSNKLKEDLSDNERNEIESTINLIKNLTSTESDDDLVDAVETTSGFGNRNSNEKLKQAEKLGYIVSYSSRNLVTGATPNSMGTFYQVQDTKRIFGTAMSEETVNLHKLDAIGHNGEEKRNNYEYKFITYQFMFGSKVATNSGLFARPKSSPGDWFMCTSFPASSTYETEFGDWMREQEINLLDIREEAIQKGTDVLSPDYAELIQLGEKVEITNQKGSEDKLFTLSRDVVDGAVKFLINGTTAGSIETEPINLAKLAEFNTELTTLATEIYGSTGMNILELKNGTNLKSRVTDASVISRLSEKVKLKRSTSDTLKLDIFEETDEKRVVEISIGDSELPIVMIKTARGIIPFIKQADTWSPFLGLKENRVLSNQLVGVEESNFYDAEIANIASNLDQLLTNDSELEKSSVGIGHDRVNSIISSYLRYDPNLLNSDKEDSDVSAAIINQFYNNIPKNLDQAKIPLKQAIELIKITSGNVSFSKPMVIRKGRKSGHSLVFYSTRSDSNLEDKSSEDLQNIYKTIAANRTPDEESVDELLGLNREGIGVIWLNQKGYSFSDLNDIVENTNTQLSKKMFQLTTWGNANDNLVSMFTAIAKVTDIHDESNRLEELMDHFDRNVPISEVKLWADKVSKTNPEAFNALKDFVSYVFTPEALGKISTYFTTNNHLDSLLAIQEEGRIKDMESDDILEQMKEYVEANKDSNIDKILEDYNITLKDLAQMDIASKSDLQKGEVVRNKKTGKPSVNYDIIRFIPKSVSSALTGQDENITPEINLVNLFQRLNSAKFADHKGDILKMFDDLLPNVPGMTDNIYASPFISLNSGSSIEVGISPDNGDLMTDLTTTAKMIAHPGVSMDINSVVSGYIFDKQRVEKSDSKADLFEDTKTRVSEEAQEILSTLDESEEPDYDSALIALRDIKRTYKGDEGMSIDEASVLDSIVQSNIKTVTDNYNAYKASLLDNQMTNLPDTSIMEYLGVSEESENELDLYTELHSLDFIREHFLFDNNIAEAYVRAINSVDIDSFISNPVREFELTLKKEQLIEGLNKFIKSSPLPLKSDIAVNIKLASLDLDNPVKINDRFLEELIPEDNSFLDWNTHKTSRPSVPHLYSMLTNGDIDEAQKASVRGILKYGVGRRGKKIRMELVGMLQSGKFEIVEYNGLLEELASIEGQEASDTFASSEAVINAFEVFKQSRVADDNTKIEVLQNVYESLLKIKESERTEGLIQLQSALRLLLENQKNLPENGISLLESVENSLNLSIISESHHKGELTLSQQMMDIFENTVSYSKKGLSKEAEAIFSEMKVDPNIVPGLIQIHNHTQNPTEAGQPAYLEALDEFKTYLRTKTDKRSILREFNNLISESFCK